MSTLELKQKLYKQIELTDNAEVLEEVYRILELGSFNEQEIQLSSEFKEAIDRGLEDYRQGRIVSNEQAKNEFKEWLSK
ncbi:MAG: hypothetical protein IPI46_13380 [Bacteroidetes bacterium]|nr:hypothetical protein [Bacteroidota bacterium]